MNFDLNSLDTTTADDGLNTIVDSAGNRFQRLVTGGIVSKVSKLISTAGIDVTIADNETADVIEIKNTGTSAFNVFLPDATVRKTQIKIADVGNNAGTYSISVKPKNGSGQTMPGGAAAYIIDSNGGEITLDLMHDLSGWI